MHVRHPIGLRQLSAPGVEALAILFTLESLSQALLATVNPSDARALLGDAQRSASCSSWQAASTSPGRIRLYGG